jgi:hypothetical protein
MGVKLKINKQFILLVHIMQMPEVVLCVWLSNLLPHFRSLSELVFRLPSVKPLPLNFFVHSLAVMLFKEP